MYSNELVCNILDYIDININSKITIDDIVLKYFYNRYYIIKIFKKELGISIFNYINYIRINNSLSDIRNGYSITRTSLNNGFYSVQYFSETFKKIIGISPRKFVWYCHNRLLLSDNDIYIINNNLVVLYNILERVQKYRKNRKPSSIPVLKKSIFR